MKRRTGGACTSNIIPTPRPSRRCCQRKRGTPIGVPLCVSVWLPVRDVDLRLDVNDPPVMAEVGRDIDRRGHANRRVDGSGGLGGGGEANDGGCDPTSDDGGKWYRPRPESGSPGRQHVVRTGTRSGRIKSSLVTSPALDTAADTPAGIAGRVMPWCTGRRSTPIARRWKGLRPCASPPTQAEGGDLDT